MLLPNKETIMERLVVASRKLKDLFKPEDIELGVIKSKPPKPSRKEQEACFDFLKAYGLASIIGYDIADTVISPYIAVAALPVLHEECKKQLDMCQALNPTPSFFNPSGKVLTKSEAEKYLTFATEIFGALFVIDTVHCSIHRGLMLGDTGQEEDQNCEGMLWGLQHFCPKFHDIGKTTNEITSIDRPRAVIFSSVVSTSFYKEWSATFDEVGGPRPWWFNHKLEKLYDELTNVNVDVNMN